MQTDLIKALAATGKPVILVNCSGSAMAMPWEVETFARDSPGVVSGRAGWTRRRRNFVWRRESQRTLAGHVLRLDGGLAGFTDYSMSNRTYRYFNGKPEFAFGHGLSYTKFKFTKSASWNQKAFPPTARRN